MWWIEKGARVYLALGATDMRCGINGLSLMVESLMEGAVFSGDLFVFANRAQTTIKLIYWAESGFCPGRAASGKEAWSGKRFAGPRMKQKCAR